MATRFNSPPAEAKYAWLKAVIDAYYISDTHIETHIAEKSITPACHKGCHACCLKPTVPFTEPELLAISWYVSEVLEGDARPRVKLRLVEHEQRLECPFLIDRECSIYPVRPLACRQFLVKFKACDIGEDVGITRPNDIIHFPREKVARPVAMRLLDHYKFKSATAKRKAFEAGFIGENARDMNDYDWSRIAKTMEHFDNEA